MDLEEIYNKRDGNMNITNKVTIENYKYASQKKIV